MIQLRRKYSMSDGKLIETANKVLVGANRDVAELTPYLYDQAAIDAIDAKNEAFSDLPTDEELSAMMMDATLAKNTKRTEAIEFVMVEIMSRVGLVFGDDSPKYKRFRSNLIHNQPDGDFIRTLKGVKRQTLLLQSQLATGAGLTSTHITTLASFITDFDNLLENQDESIDNRDIAVEDRITAGNDLYKDLLNLSDIGKRKWLNVSEAKYNDYVLYPNQTTVPESQVFEASVGSLQVVNISATAIKANSQIVVENLGTEGLFVYFAASPTDLPTNTMPGGPGWVAAGTTGSGQAAEAGYLAGSREYLNTYNPGTGIGNLRVTID